MSNAVGGFDAFVGNPPFAGKNTLLAVEGERYADWLKSIHAESHGNSDLVAHFYRRAFDLLRPGGTFGLVATNTIAQGDTRATGLRWICKHGGVIYDATRRYKWPGLAAVIVSIVHVQREPNARVQAQLDGTPVERISAFLFHQGVDDDPIPLVANANKSFQGSIILGMGFTFDDTNVEATAIAEMHRLIAKDPRNQDRIFPYLGGEELNSSPTHAHHRFVINFAQMSEDDARRWPDLMSIVELKVRPGRLRQNRDVRKKYWWRFGETAPALYETIHLLDRVLVIARVSDSCALAFLPARQVFSEQLVVFALDTMQAFGVLQSRVHELWARFLGSSMKDDLRYAPSDCFETFPFPDQWQENLALADAGRRYYDFRAVVMKKADEGLTATYNRFHDPDERSPDLVELRRFHDDMDRAVLDEFGWTDLRPTCTFILDYEEDQSEDEGSGRTRKKKKPWRYRWSDDVRDEVLARLLALNADRAAEEKQLGEEAKLASSRAAAAGPRPPRRTKGSKRDAGPKLPGVE